MARLREGEYEQRMQQIFFTLRRHRAGLREQEIAEILGWHRRTVNNYLHELESRDRAYREGWLWFAE